MTGRSAGMWRHQWLDSPMKLSLKRIANGIFSILSAPFAYPVRWLAPFDRDDALFSMVSQMASLIPGLPGIYFRRSYYRTALGLRSTGFVIEFGTLLAQRGIEIGSNAYIGANCNIGLSIIGDDVLLGSNVHIISGRHVHSFQRADIPIRLQGGTLKKTVIGHDCWVGNNAVVMADLGDGCVVGAGSVVTKSIPPKGVVAGNPAQLIQRRGEKAQRD